MAPSAEEAPGSATPAAPRPSAQLSDFEGTAGIVEKIRGEQVPAKLIAVRTARHAHFDRVVFEFTGPVPGYHLEYIDKPVRRCGSGEATAVAGEGWLEVRLAPADAHDEEGHALVKERERTLQLGVLRELELTCDFEAIVTWVLGVAAPNRYRVLELAEPSRLVVDVRH